MLMGIHPTSMLRFSQSDWRWFLASARVALRASFEGRRERMSDTLNESCVQHQI